MCVYENEDGNCNWDGEPCEGCLDDLRSRTKRQTDEGLASPETACSMHKWKLTCKSCGTVETWEAASFEKATDKIIDLGWKSDRFMGGMVCSECAIAQNSVNTWKVSTKHNIKVIDMEKVIKEDVCHLHARKKYDKDWCASVIERLGEEAESVCGACLIFKRLRGKKCLKQEHILSVLL